MPLLTGNFISGVAAYIVVISHRHPSERSTTQGVPSIHRIQMFCLRAISGYAVASPVSAKLTAATMQTLIELAKHKQTLPISILI